VEGQGLKEGGGVANVGQQWCFWKEWLASWARKF